MHFLGKIDKKYPHSYATSFSIGSDVAGRSSETKTFGRNVELSRRARSSVTTCVVFAFSLCRDGRFVSAHASVSGRDFEVGIDREWRPS